MLHNPATSFFGLLWRLLCIPTLPPHHGSLGYLLSLWCPSPSFQVRVRMFSVKACCTSGRGHPCQFCFAAVPTGCYLALGESPCSEERIPLHSTAYIQPLQANALRSVKFMYMGESLFPLLLGFYLQQATFLHWGRLDVPLGDIFQPFCTGTNSQCTTPMYLAQAEWVQTVPGHLVFLIHYALPHIIFEGVSKNRRLFLPFLWSFQTVLEMKAVVGLLFQKVLNSF